MVIKRFILQHTDKLLPFTLIGFAGFFVDALLLTLLVSYGGFNVYISRLFSFTSATLVTWLLNRSYTFRTHTAFITSKRREYAKYIFVQICGALLNLTVFSYIILLYPALKTTPVIPLAIGAAGGLILNYLGTHYWVYKRQTQ